MMTSRGFARVSPGLAFQNQILRAPVRSTPRQVTLQSSTSSPRQFGTSLRSHGTPVSPTSRIGFLTGSRVGAAGILSSQSILLSSRRFRSTDTTTAPPASTTPPTSTTASEFSADNVNPGYTSFSDLDSLPVEPLYPIDDISAGVGYLSQLGLDYGFGPTTLCQWGMEQIHFNLGMPWWASIIGFALATRIVLFYPGLIAQQTSARSQEMNKDPVYKDTMDRFKEVALSGKDSTAEVIQLRNQLSYMKNQWGVKTWHMCLPFLQAPLAYGMFKLTRAMSALPVPGMDLERMLWVSDFTLPDPLYLLPCVSVALMYITMKKNVPFMDPSQAAVGKVIPFILGPISLAITMFLPASTQLYFAATAALQWAQTRFYFIPSVRKAFGLPPLIRKDEQPTMSGGPKYQAPRTVDTTAVEHEPPAGNSIFRTFREAKNEMTEKASEWLRGRGQKQKAGKDKEGTEEWRRAQEADEVLRRQAKFEQQWEKRRNARKQMKQR